MQFLFPPVSTMIDLNQFLNMKSCPHVLLFALLCNPQEFTVFDRLQHYIVSQDGLTPLDLCLYSGQDTKTYELIKLLKKLPKQP